MIRLAPVLRLFAIPVLVLAVACEVISIPASWGPTSIDLIQFAEPFNPAPPYESPSHLGMAYAALLTTDLDADVTRMREQGWSFSQNHTVCRRTIRWLPMARTGSRIASEIRRPAA